ncbi:hypothetical protein [Pandoraea faecigallinarum]|uniref:hypothetical protein n=1 Tax=Pandoraea faecigallinarum TaxID=656179 RepID=UPI000A6F79C7|nr:hypothetical protein [Pandoraea faecigallinarum]
MKGKIPHSLGNSSPQVLAYSNGVKRRIEIRQAILPDYRWIILIFQKLVEFDASSSEFGGAVGRKAPGGDWRQR